MVINLAKELQAVGFSEKQAKVYVACLELGPSPVQKIAQQAGLVRPTAYVILDELKNKGLIQEVVMKKKKMFSAIDPENILGLLKKEQFTLDLKMKKFQKIVLKLRVSSRRGGDYPRLTVYEGYEGIEKMREDMDARGSSSFEEIVPLDVAYQFFPPAENDHRAKLEVGPPIKTIYTSHDVTLPAGKNVLRKKIVGQDGITTEIVIADQVVYFADMGKRILAFAVEHEGVSRTMRELFNLAWESKKLRAAK